MTRLALHFFGTPRVERDGEVLGVERRKFLALLAYLALDERPRSRAELTGLLWPNLPEKRALAVLRSTLWEGQQVLGEGWLETGRGGVQLRPGAPIWVDVTRFNHLAGFQQPGPHQPPPPPALLLARLEEAASLYRGDFLQGFSLRDSDVFDQWSSVQAELLHTRMVEVLEQLSRLHADQRQLPQAIAWAQRLQAMMPTHEEAHRHLMWLYAQGGQRALALEQYSTCVRLLSEQLAVRPQEETVRLFEAIRSATLPREPEAPVGAPASEPPVDEAPLPEPPAAFIGRQHERALIAQRLATPGCRLLTLTGPGGVGKTSLALQAAREYAARHGGAARVVSLVGVDSPALLASTLLGALAVPAPPCEEPEARLLEYLRARPLLLVLDNFEHLLAGAPLVARLLAHAPGLRLLVTSRERLDVRGEWELVLEGLPVPQAQALGEGDAVELFLQAAARVDASFQPTAEAAPHLARICQRLGGLPLALELAASWVALLSLEDIAARVEREELDFLVGPRDAPERQRTLRATFLHSWNLLAPCEQQALRSLSVFRGGATPEAAWEVAGTPLEVLAGLVRKSLVRRTAAGRYELHELIRQYAAEQLHASAEDSPGVEERHAAWYAGLLARAQPGLDGEQPRAALARLLPELDNVRTAWARALQQGWRHVLAQALDGFCRVHELHGQQREASAALRQALVRLQGAPGGDERERRLLRGRLLAWLGRLLLVGEAPGQAAALLEESQRLLRELEAPEALRLCLDATATLARLQADPAAARWCLRVSLLLSQSLGDRRGEAQALGALSAVALDEGDGGEARRLLEQSLDLLQLLGEGRRVAVGLGRLGQLLAQEGDLERAEQACREGLLRLEPLGEPGPTAELLGALTRVLCQRGELDEARRCGERHLALGRGLEHPELIASAQLGLGLVALRAGQHAQARGLLEESLALHRRLHARQGIIESLLALGRLALEEGGRERARGHLHAALEMALEVGSPPRVLEALVGLAELPSPSPSPEVRQALAGIAIHPAAWLATRRRAEHLLSAPPAPASGALEAHPPQELSSLVTAVLGALA